MGKLFSLLGALVVYTCVATTVAQGVGMAGLWANGGLTQVKIRKYAAIVYGLDITSLDFDDPDNSDSEPNPATTREDLLQARLGTSTALFERRRAVKKGADDIRALAQQLSTKRERYEIVAEGFTELLEQQERHVHATALQEVRRTLEVLKPRQAKDLLIAMLRDAPGGANDNVLGDVLEIVRGMPEDKLKKIFGEFKTDDERSELHRVLVAIGELDKR